MGMLDHNEASAARKGGATVPRRHPIARIAIVVFDGFDELDAIAPLEILTNAARAGARHEIGLVALSAPGKVMASHGLNVAVPHRLESDTDLVIVPGGGWNAEPGTPGTRVEIERGLLPAAVATLHSEGATIASVCTGAMIVAAAGLLKGRPATTHHVALEDLARTGASLVDARVVDDGDVITAGGVTSGIDLALWLVEREWGEDLARRVASQIEYERVGNVWKGRV
jgi:transcriptional regulator GlxA family with amidase domain